MAIYIKSFYSFNTKYFSLNIIIPLFVTNVIITFLQIGANVRSILEIAFCTFVEYFFRWILSTSFSRSRIFFATRYFKVHGRSSHKSSYSSQMISRLSYPLCRTPCNQIVIRIVYWPSYFFRCYINVDRIKVYFILK